MPDKKEEIVEGPVEATEDSENMASEITFTDEFGVQFTIGFDRASAMQAEAIYGLSFSEAMSGKSYVIRNLFAASFIKNHPNIKPQTVERLWANMRNKRELYQTLALIYGNTAGSVLEEPEEGKGTSWTIL